MRKGRLNEDSDLVRLSFRDLFWYCYLDQDSMDSSFFNLDDKANPHVRLKSRDVLRFIVGFHQEQVSDLEAELEDVQEVVAKPHPKPSKRHLKPSNWQLLWKSRRCDKKSAKRFMVWKLKSLESGRQPEKFARTKPNFFRNDSKLSKQLAEIDDALGDVEQNIVKDKSHRNTLLSLATRQKRAQSARYLLTGVEFAQCPQCYQTLKPQEDDVCPVCGQARIEMPQSAMDEDSIETDTKARADELEERVRSSWRNLNASNVSANFPTKKLCLIKTLTKLHRNMIPVIWPRLWQWKRNAPA